MKTGKWLSQKSVLISTIPVRKPNCVERILPIELTMAQVRHSPDIDTDKPVSRQYESEYLGYYGYPYYWGGRDPHEQSMDPYTSFPGYAAVGGIRDADVAFVRAKRALHKNDDARLRSCEAVIGYRVTASDGELGQVSSFLVDEETWSLRYVIIILSNWWTEHKVLVAPEWVAGIDSIGQIVSIKLTKATVRGAPEYDSSEAATTGFVDLLQDHHIR